jgi:hypothetical protein
MLDRASNADAKEFFARENNNANSGELDIEHVPRRDLQLLWRVISGWFKAKQWSSCRRSECTAIGLDEGVDWHKSAALSEFIFSSFVSPERFSLWLHSAHSPNLFISIAFRLSIKSSTRKSIESTSTALIGPITNYDARCLLKSKARRAQERRWISGSFVGTAERRTTWKEDEKAKKRADERKRYESRLYGDRNFIIEMNMRRRKKEEKVFPSLGAAPRASNALRSVDEASEIKELNIGFLIKGFLVASSVTHEANSSTPPRRGE